MKKPIRFFIPLVPLVFLLLTATALAQSDSDSESLVPCGGTKDPCTICHLVLMASNIFAFILKVSLGFAILFAAIAGILYISSSGSEALMATAKNAIKYAALGFALALLAWVLVNIVANALGYKEQWWSLDIECEFVITEPPTPEPPGPEPPGPEDECEPCYEAGSDKEACDAAASSGSPCNWNEETQNCECRGLPEPPKPIPVPEDECDPCYEANEYDLELQESMCRAAKNRGSPCNWNEETQQCECKPAPTPTDYCEECKEHHGDQTACENVGGGGYCTYKEDTGDCKADGPKCKVPASGYCTEEYLGKHCPSWDTKEELRNAICICKRESGGNPNLASGIDQCKDGKYSYTFGLFQIWPQNLKVWKNIKDKCAHKNIFSVDPSGAGEPCCSKPNPTCKNAKTLGGCIAKEYCKSITIGGKKKKYCTKRNCEMKNKSRYDYCANLLYNPVFNVETACKMYDEVGWSPWGGICY